MHVWDDKFGHQTFRYKKYAYTKSKAGTYVSLYGDRLKRITKWDKDQSNLFESDVNPEIRVLVDNYTDSDDVSTKPLDINVLSKYLHRDDWDSLSFNRRNYYDKV